MLFTKVLEIKKSKYNGEIKVVKSLGYGTYFQVNGLTQSGGIVETIWNETIKHLYHSLPTIHNSLILGLGGGSVVKVLRKYYPKAHITGVDIDPVIVDLGKKYLDLDKYNVDIKIMDAKKFPLKKYDLVIVDGFVGDNYIHLERLHLTRSTIVVFNKLFYKDKKDEALKFGKKLKKIFDKVEYFYPPANLMFVCYKANSKNN